MGRIWSALLRIATMLIFTLRPASSIRPMPDRTVARSPLRAMERKAAASMVSRLTLMRRSPAATIRSAFRASSWPLVVMQTSFKGSVMRAGRSSSNFGDTSGSPPVMCNFSTPAASISSSTARRISSAPSSSAAACSRRPLGTQ